MNNYKTIEEYLEKGEYNKVLEDFSPVFSTLDEYTTYLTNSKIDPENTERLLMRATGYWGLLDLAYNVIDSFKTKKEGEFYCNKKIDVEKANEKFNASATDKEASASVNTERRIRNIIESYRNRADRIITSSQSYLKHISESYKRAGKQEG